MSGITPTARVLSEKAEVRKAVEADSAGSVEEVASERIARGVGDGVEGAVETAPAVVEFGHDCRHLALGW